MSESVTIPAHIPAHLVFDFNIYGDPRVSSNLHTSYVEALADAPDLFYTPRNGGHWVARGYDVIEAILQDPEHFSSKQNEIPRVENPPVFIPLDLDPPHNIPFRMALMPSFSPKAVSALQPKIRHWAETIVGQVAAKGACDFVADVSAIYPVSIFMEFTGLPLERLDEFRALSEGFFSAHSQDADAVAAVAAKVIGIMMEIAEQRRAQPQEDLISRLVTADVNGRPITQEELQSMFFLLFLGGMHTVTNAAAFMFRHLARDPALQKQLAEHPERISAFVEEGLRCFGVINAPRLVTGNIEKFGAPLRKDDMVLCLMALGGRDERKNPDAVTFDLDRKDRKHLTFSSGTHLCIGHYLARAELRALTEEWLRRIPRFSLQSDEPQPFRANITFDIVRLPLRWETP